ncbi:TetR/AcrR family transcriptional regulator [Cohnella terricola]|uniref:TetR/AcrR family transcriptional regulator n=1 Tax=Cohnella terricola TaxID=1289167 RepID=A0A559JAJ1_9BACL|nr:TetR/AcrR family transcriptional regulator [Cohnella terricola]TVX96904.1 TetR/AcrR family transcriptional regulator [Cohnella terricola]
MEIKNKSGGKTASGTEYHRRILDAAARLMERNGIDSVNMYQIAQEAGIGQGTLYRRYEHPGEIYSELLRTSMEQFVDRLEAQLELDGDSSAAILGRLRDAIERAVDYIDDHVDLLDSINCMYAGKKSSMLDKRPVMIRLRTLVTSYLDLAVERGETREIDVTLTTSFLLAALGPGQYMYHRDTMGYTKERYLAEVVRLFIDGSRK